MNFDVILYSSFPTIILFSSLFSYDLQYSHLLLHCHLSSYSYPPLHFCVSSYTRISSNSYSSLFPVFYHIPISYHIASFYNIAILNWIPVLHHVSICLYFCITGYGALVPTNDASRIFTCFYLLFGIGFVLTVALEVAKLLIITVQNRLLSLLNASDNIVLKEMNKIGLCVVFLLIGVLMGTWFFAVNEDWTAAQAFYWTIVTMTVSTNDSYVT